MQAASLEANRVLTCAAANGVKETQDEIAAILSNDAENDKRKWKWDRNISLKKLFRVQI